MAEAVENAHCGVMDHDTIDDDMNEAGPIGDEGDDTTASDSSSQPRRLRRSSDSRLTGVAAGVAEYFNIDPTLVRIGFVVLSLAAPPIALAYLVGWAVMPRPVIGVAAGLPDRQSNRTALLVLLAVVLLAFGGPLFAFGWLFGGPGVAFPVALLVLAAVLLVLREDGGTFAVKDRVPRRGSAKAPSPPPPLVGEALAPPPVLPPPPKPEVRRSKVLTPLTFAVLAVFFGVAFSGEAAGWWELNAVLIFAAALLIVGTALVASAFFGRAFGLIPLGIFLVFGLLAATALEPILRDGVGSRTFAPTSTEELKPIYSLGAGELYIDLRGLDLSGGQREVQVELGMGQVRIDVPADLLVEIHSELGAGELVIFDRAHSGLDLDRTDSNGVSPEEGTLVIELDVGAGSGKVDVSRVLTGAQR
jgi:phage shock protein PspC (stress-responsive transcriptional regulator)